MGKNHSHGTNNHDTGGKKALRRVEEARASYAKAEDRVATLRVRLQHAEEKLARRATRLTGAEEAVTALARAQDDAGAEPRATDTAATTTAVSADITAMAPAHAADDLAAVATPGEPLTPVQAADDLARVAATAGNGAKPRRSRARRPSSTSDEI